MSGKRKRPPAPPPNILTEEEVKQHQILIEDLTKQCSREKSEEKKTELRKQMRNLRSELWIHRNTKVKVSMKQATYKGAEY